jgi:PTS system ascorbate-specific IIA component
MSVGVLLITHGSVGAILLDTAHSILGSCPLPTAACAISLTDSATDIQSCLQQTWQRINQGDGVLILTDLYGATPSNLACQLLCCGQTRLVSGVNLPMLLRVLNYPTLGLDELAVKASSGGEEGIVTFPNL